MRFESKKFKEDKQKANNMFRRLFGKDLMNIKEIGVNTALMLIISAILLLIVFANIYGL